MTSSLSCHLVDTITMGLSALADKTGIVLTKSKDKFCHDNFLSCLRCLHSKFQIGQILSTALVIFLCRARQNIEHFGGIIDHVQILVLVAYFVLLNLAQIAGETLLMVCLFLRHQFLQTKLSF